MMKVLIVESEFLHQDTWVGNAVERLADALSQQNVTVIKSTSFDDGFAILSSNEAIDCLMFSYQMEHPDEHQNVRQLIGKLHERQQNVPVFLLGDREKALAAMDRDLLELVDEFAWILEDTADFIAGRAVAAMTRYRQQLLPPLFSALMKYSDIHEYSWAAPGHQGGVGFTKTPAGRFYHDYYGENLFRTDMGIERTSLGSLLDHTGAFGESEKYAARVFGADRSWSVVVGTSGSNRTIMQACMTDNDVVVVDRNCHKSIEQGLMLTGAKPVYMVPSRNRYGIIGPIYPQEMQPETLQKKINESPLTKDKAGQKPSYCVVTNCTYDGVCYNAKEAQDLLEKTSDRLHFDEAWYGYARFNPIYADHYAMRGEPGDHNGPTVFATHSTHKLLNALSQASYIHVREGRGAINFSRFNQAYMMHATTSPLYAICASNDVAVSMMDGNSGLSLTQEGVLDIIQRAGINVLWNDNDGGCKGVCDRVPHQNITALNLPGQCINGECYDEVLFHGLEEYINNLQSDGLIVLHTIGSHGPTYYNRYPPQFRKFTPTCDTNEIQTCTQEQLVNTYDNTLVYVDYIVDKAINLLKEHQDKFTTSLVYLSDHGESLGENGIYLHGLPYAIAPDSQKQVPMLLWLSEDYQKRYQVDQNCLQKQAQTQHYSQDNLFSTLLGLTGVETKYYQAADDILQTCRRVSE